MEMEALWDAQQVAAFLGVPRSTVYSLTETGVIPSVRLGKRLLRYRPDDIEALATSAPAVEYKHGPR